MLNKVIIKRIAKQKVKKIKIVKNRSIVISRGIHDVIL